MKLQSFRIRNYKSIIDSGTCRLSDNDNVLVLAGQNESGKSSVLQALYDYERGELLPNAQRSFESDVKYPVIECTYAIDDDDDILAEIKDEIPTVPSGIQKIFSKIKTITLIRTFTSEQKSTLGLDVETTGKIETLKPAIEKSVTQEKLKDVTPILRKETSSKESTASDTANEDEGLINEKTVSGEEVADVIWQISPKIIFFDDFCDLLPERILISELKDEKGKAKGYRAVKNIEAILNIDLTDLDSMKDAPRTSQQDIHNKMITADFNERWKQKIFEDNEVKISIQYEQGRKEDGAYLNFFILTKEGEYLAPEQRSKGLVWFLSFYLQLMAESKKTDELIILFDEPGLFLHAKAQKDIKDLFEELAEKDQIIYSTHSPYLIDTSKLRRVRLVLNSREEGTQVEKITTKKVKNQKDALQPIIDAMGLEIAHGFSPMKNRNVIVEGISDFHYLTAMKKLLGVKTEFAFVPSMGATNVHLLMELCIGWGLEWLIVLDDGKTSKNAYKYICDSFFDNRKEEADQKIYMLSGADAIEDAFTVSDLQLVESEAKFSSSKKKSDVVQEHGGKELFARKFLEKVDKQEIKKSSLGKSTVNKFENLFAFIELQFTEQKEQRAKIETDKSFKPVTAGSTQTA